MVHWNDVEAETFDVGPMRGVYRDLGRAAGSYRASVCRFDLAPGGRSSPAHRHGAEEEIFFVLAGSGLSWQDSKNFEVGPGDGLLHRPLEEAHTLIAGPDGIDVLAFGPAIFDEATHLPRAGVVRINETWVLAPGDPHPWEREAAAGEIESPPPGPRPSTIVALANIPERAEDHGETGLRERDFGRELGSVTTGMSHVVVARGRASYPFHCHSVEEELFVVLDGAGVVELGDEEIPVRAGSVVARPPGTRVAHRFRAAPDSELTYLAWGTRESSDIAFYPRSGKVNLRGIGLMTRLERLDYYDGEA